MTRVQIISASSSRPPASNPFSRTCIALVLVWATNLSARTPADEATVDADGTQRLTIVGGSYFFKPEHVLAKAGKPLELIVRMEEGIVPHRFVLEGPDGKPAADIELSTMPKNLRIDLPPGQYSFACPNRLLMFKSHRERGMSGILEIRE